MLFKLTPCGIIGKATWRPGFTVEARMIVKVGKSRRTGGKGRIPAAHSLLQLGAQLRSKAQILRGKGCLLFGFQFLGGALGSKLLRNQFFRSEFFCGRLRQALLLGFSGGLFSSGFFGSQTFGFGLCRCAFRSKLFCGKFFCGKLRQALRFSFGSGFFSSGLLSGQALGLGFYGSRAFFRSTDFGKALRCGALFFRTLPGSKFFGGPLLGGTPG